MGRAPHVRTSASRRPLSVTRTPCTRGRRRVSCPPPVHTRTATAPRDRNAGGRAFGKHYAVRGLGPFRSGPRSGAAPPRIPRRHLPNAARVAGRDPPVAAASPPPLTAAPDSRPRSVRNPHRRLPRRHGAPARPLVVRQRPICHHTRHTVHPPSSNRNAGNGRRSPICPRPRTAPIGFGGYRYRWWHLFAKKRPRPGFYVDNEDGIPAHSRHVVPSVCQCARLAGTGCARNRPPKLAVRRIGDLPHSPARRRALGRGDATHQTVQPQHRQSTRDSPSCRHGVHLPRPRPPPAGRLER